jgi:hypothetical protein
LSPKFKTEIPGKRTLLRSGSVPSGQAGKRSHIKKYFAIALLFEKYSVNKWKCLYMVFENNYDFILVIDLSKNKLAAKTIRQKL